jgi:hypothetical protein
VSAIFVSDRSDNDACLIDFRLSDLVDALDDPDGDPHSIQASLRETLSLSAKMGSTVTTPDRSNPSAVTRASISMQSATPPASRRQFAATVDALKLRDTKLTKAEDTATKFLEVIACAVGCFA